MRSALSIFWMRGALNAGSTLGDYSTQIGLLMQIAYFQRHVSPWNHSQVVMWFRPLDEDGVLGCCRIDEQKMANLVSLQCSSPAALRARQ